jgi:hypothetical protein
MSGKGGKKEKEESGECNIGRYTLLMEHYLMRVRVRDTVMILQCIQFQWNNFNGTISMEQFQWSNFNGTSTEGQGEGNDIETLYTFGRTINTQGQGEGDSILLACTMIMHNFV